MAKDKGKKHGKQKSAKRAVIPSGEVVIVKAEELSEPKSMLLFGQYKRGKSTLAASIADVFENVLVIDIDDGSSAFASEYPTIDVVRINRFDVAAFDKFWKKLIKDDGSYGGVQYDVIILDTMSILHGWKLGTLPKSLGWDRIVQAGDYTSKLMWDLHRISPLGIGVFHAEIADTMRGTEDEQYRVMTPALTGKEIKRMLGPIPDVLAFCDIEEDEEGDPIYTVTLRPTETTMTGSRFRAFPTKLAEPTMARLYEIIRNGGVD